MKLKRPPWNNNTYPWKVGHRLHKSHKTLPHKKARAYFRELRKRGCKTRFIYQEIPLSELITYTFSTYEQKMTDTFCAENPVLRMLREKGCFIDFDGGATITKPLRYK